MQMTKEALLARTELTGESRMKKILHPELGEVFFRVIGGRELGEFQRVARGSKTDIEMAVMMLRLSLCDERGQLLIETDEEAERLIDLPAKLINDLSEHAFRINAVTDQQAEELAGN